MSQESKPKNSTHQRKKLAPKPMPIHRTAEERKKTAAKQLRKQAPDSSTKPRRSKKERPIQQKKSRTEEQPNRRLRTAKQAPSSRGRKQKVPQKTTASIRQKQGVRKTQPKRNPKKKRSLLKSMRRRALELGAALAAAALLFFLVSSFFIKIASVSGYSMMPTLQDNNTVLIQKTKTIDRFDLVLFQRGETQQIRRIIGLPEEQIKYSEDFLYVNGKAVDEKFIIDEINEAQKHGGQYTADFELYTISEKNVIPKNCYLVLGDNREYGYDSRDYGLIDGQQIIGVVKMRLLPLNDLSAF